MWRGRESVESSSRVSFIQKEQQEGREGCHSDCPLTPILHLRPPLPPPPACRCLKSCTGCTPLPPPCLQVLEVLHRVPKNEAFTSHALDLFQITFAVLKVWEEQEEGRGELGGGRKGCNVTSS